MEMQQVRYFVALAKELNFTRAAEACNVTQPALTRAIQALEAELGGPLFHRERNQTHLSELGRMMQPYLEAVVAQTRTAKQQAESFRKLENLDLKLGAMCTIGPNVLSDFIVGFYGEHKGVALIVSDSSGALLPEKLLNGDLEVGLFGLPEGLDERLHAMPLFKERFMCVLPAQHALARQNAVRCKDLDGVPYVNRINCEMGFSAGPAFAALGVEFPTVFRSERDEWVLGMIRAGMGWGFFPEFCHFPPDVAVRPLVEPVMEREISMVTVRGRPHSPAVGAFVRSARSHRWPQQSAFV